MEGLFPVPLVQVPEVEARSRNHGDQALPGLEETGG